jgi:hypothetical protein
MDLSDQFITKKQVIGGEECFLICPHKQGTVWTPENLIYRSSIWNQAGEPISLGFKKFFNLTEKPHIVGEPGPDDPITVVEKLDGSLIVVSVYKGELIVRTRETFTCAQHGFHGKKVIQWVKNIPLIKHYAEKMNCSLVFESLDPHNRIIVPHAEFKLVLLGVINHGDYTYMEQFAVDLVAAILEVERPKTFNYSLTELAKLVAEGKDFEGYCIYFNKDQKIVKWKTPWYLKGNYLKSTLKRSQLIEDFVNSGANTKEEFVQRFADKYDYEILSYLDTRWIFEAKKVFDEKCARALIYVHELKGLEGKERAEAVYENVPKNLIDYVFGYLSHGDLDSRFKIKKLKEICKKQLQIGETAATVEPCLH